MSEAAIVVTPPPQIKKPWRLPGGPKLQNWLFGWWTIGVFIFLYVPIVLLVIFSFNESRLNIRWEGFWLKWYGVLFQNERILGAFKNSLIVAAATTVLSTFIGTVGAWMLHRYRYPFKQFLDLLVLVPMVMPEVLMGVSLLLFFVSMKIGLGYLTLIIAHTTFCFPFVLVGVQARLQGIDPFLEEAAMDLGATPIQAFWKVIVPYLMPAIISGALMSFTLSFDEYIVTVFTMSAQAQTFPVTVYGMVKRGLDPSLNALSTLFILATVILVLFTETLKKLK
ncbi:MAG TPA: ABC transporter permease [Chthoniobacterales bacterium]